MSYAIWMIIDTGGVLPASVGEIINHTSNTSPMWTKALGMRLRELEDLTGWEAKPTVNKGVYDMRMNPDEYTPMNPENGWGDYESALSFLEKLLEMCSEHPKATIRMSY